MLSNGVDSFLKAYLVKNLIKKLTSVQKFISIKESFVLKINLF